MTPDEHAAIKAHIKSWNEGYTKGYTDGAERRQGPMCAVCGERAYWRVEPYRLDEHSVAFFCSGHLGFLSGATDNHYDVTGVPSG